MAALSLTQFLMAEHMHPDPVSEPSSKVKPCFILYDLKITHFFLGSNLLSKIRVFSACFSLSYFYKQFLLSYFLAEEDWNMPIESFQYLIIFFRVDTVFIFSTLLLYLYNRCFNFFKFFQAKKVKSRSNCAAPLHPKPMTPLIRQILDMGFLKHHIDHALTCESLELLFNNS